jgi:hypothetical protein
MGGVLPVTVKLSARERELVGVLAALERSSRSGLIRAAIMARVRERLAPMLERTEPAPIVPVLGHAEMDEGSHDDAGQALLGEPNDAGRSPADARADTVVIPIATVRP